MTTARRRLTPLAAMLLIAFILAPGFVAAADSQTFEGTLLVAHGDDLDANGVPQGPGVFEYTLETAGGTVSLAFAGDKAPDGFTSGAHVRVRGNLAAGVVAVGGPNAATVVEPATVVAAASKNVAVLLVNFTTNTTKPWTLAQAQGIMFTNANSVANYFAEESFGQLTMTGKVLPEDGTYLTISSDPAACNYSDIATKAKAEAANRGISLSGYTNIQYAFPSASCGWSGLAYLPGTETWVNNALGLYVSAHELSHNFGVHHASTISCTESGVRVALSSNLGNCSYSEYGDPFSVMGNGGGRHTHGQQLASLGWLSGSNLQTVSATGTYALTSADDAGTAVKAIRVARGDGSYLYLELRQPVGSNFDNFSTSDPAVNGVSLRIANDWGAIIQSKLIDTTPATSSYNDAPLTVGATFTDPLSGASITTVSIGSRTAQVLISWGGGGGGGTTDTTAPTTPGGLTAAMNGATASRLTWTASTDNVGVTGYQVRRGGVLLATVAGSPYNDNGPLVAGATYGYTVIAVDAAGNSSGAASASLVVPNPDVTAPTAPTNLRVASSTKQKVTLAWNASTDAVGIAGYRVYRNGVLATTTTSLSWADSRQKSKGATYYVVAFDQAGNVSLASNSITVAATTGPAGAQV
jgi:Gametolysin peptidase M11